MAWFWLPDSVHNWWDTCTDDGAGCRVVGGVRQGVVRGVGCAGRL